MHIRDLKGICFVQLELGAVFMNGIPQRLIHSSIVGNPTSMKLLPALVSTPLIPVDYAPVWSLMRWMEDLYWETELVLWSWDGEPPYTKYSYTLARVWLSRPWLPTPYMYISLYYL